jgi:hypothetical protein
MLPLDLCSRPFTVDPSLIGPPKLPRQVRPLHLSKETMYLLFRHSQERFNPNRTDLAPAQEI